MRLKSTEIGAQPFNTGQVFKVQKPQMQMQLKGVKGKPMGFPDPGIYTTTPYACVVVVPGDHLDDEIAIRPGDRSAEGGDPMPMLKPELHFIPFRSK